MATTLSWEDAKKFAAEGGYSKYGSTDNYLKGITVPAPQPNTQPAASSSNNSYGPPAPGSSAPPVPQSNVPAPPQRWNVDADYQTRLNHFGGNIGDAQNEILAVKDMYNKEMGSGASADRLGQIHDWARQVRGASGISEDDVTYGNGVPKPDIPAPSQPSPAPQPTTPQSTYTPPVNMSQYQPMSTQQIQQEAANRIAKMTAEKTRIANQTKQGMQTSYDRLRKTIGEDRVLENLQNERRLNPFSGRSDYALGMVERERGRTDREQAEDLVTRQGNVDAQLNDYLQRTPEEQQQIANELTRIEREYGLQVGQLTGNFNGQRTLAGQSQDFSQMDANRRFGLDEAGLTGMYNGNQTMAMQNMLFNQGMAGKQANWDAYKDSVGMTGNLGSGPKSDWGLLGGTNGQASFQGQQFQYQQLRDQIADEQYKQKFDEDVRRFGLEFAADQAYKSAQISNMNADNARQNAAVARQEGNQQLANLYDIWDRTGEAPAGIPGVTAGTKLAGKQTSTPKPSDYKNNPDFAEDIAYVRKNPAQAAQELSTNPDQFINKYGYEGFKELESYVNSLTKK